MSRKKSIIFGGVLAAGALAVVGAFGATTANADPAPGNYVAVGSDTIQDLYNSFSAQGIHSYNATLPGFTGDTALGTHITPTNCLAPTALEIGRPNGSGDGRKALSAAWNDTGSPSAHVFSQAVAFTTGTVTTSYNVTPESIDIARSSGQPGSPVAAGGSTDKETFVPLARDGVSVATKGFSWNFTTPELEAIYGAPNDLTAGGDPTAASGVWTQSGDTSQAEIGDIIRDTGNPTAEPLIVLSTQAGPHGTVIPNATQALIVLLPQPQSGTRQFFQTALGGTTTRVKATWANENNEENHADALTTPGDIIPFSAAQYIAQANGAAPDTGVASVNLNEINGNAPYTGTLPATISPNSAFFGSTSTPPVPGIGNFSRDVYSVVPTKVINGTFTPPASCTGYDSNLATLVKTTLPGLTNVSTFGFEQISYSATSGDWLHSNWEN